ncbi:J domain-containing protein [Methylophilus luteus]|uniref:DnaJ family molecular chaperone n=1 Tax=Methylophilus luteus TaxID=640108 RepID=A0ABW3FA35_9PROT
MNTEEIVVIIGGLLLGYKIVNSLMNKNEFHAQKAEKLGTESNSSENDKRHQNHRNSTNQSENKKEFIEDNWFQTLDIPESASLEEISLQYKRKIREYHPDKVASLGKEIRDLAEFKSKEINSAYEYAKSIKAP